MQQNNSKGSIMTPNTPTNLIKKGKPMTKKFAFHHGDLDLFRVDKLPKTYKLVGTMKSHTPQSSDKTGHAHTITSDAKFEVYKAEDFAYVFTSSASISHEEHWTEDFEPGIYVLAREQEEDPRTGLVMEVQD